MAFSAWSTTAASNTNATTGVNFDENQAPSTVNDAGRELMAQLKDAVVDKTSAQTLTNKTLTSPVINTPTGDVVTLTGAQTLTNKTLTSPTVSGGSISGITDLAVADGGTGASTAASARTNLGLAALATQSGSWANFTPTVTLNGAGTVPQYSTNSGRYVQIGNLVHVHVYLTGDGGNEGSGTGQIQIAIPVAASASFLAGAPVVGQLINGATNFVVAGDIAAGGSVIVLGVFDTATSGRAAQAGDQSSTSRTIRLSFSYEA